MRDKKVKRMQWCTLGMDSECRKKILWKVMTQLVDNKYEPQEWPKYLIEIIMTDFKRKPKATKWRDHPAFSFITHRAKRVARILRRKCKNNLYDVLWKYKFGFIRGKGNKDAIGTMSIILKRKLEKEELCAFFRDWLTFEHENWTKLE
jgi:hypothetical protein